MKSSSKNDKQTLYHKAVLPKFEYIKELRSQGQTEANIAKLLGISYASFTSYKEKYPEFAQVLLDAKIVLVEKLEHTMFEAALGNIKITETKKNIQRYGGKESVKIEETTKELGPNTALLIFSLRNLAPEKWKDASSIDTVNVDGAMTNMNKVFQELKEKMNEEPKPSPQAPSDK